MSCFFPENPQYFSASTVAASRSAAKVNNRPRWPRRSCHGAALWPICRVDDRNGGSASTRFQWPSLGFDLLHIGIREAEMMADLVHQHMSDDLAQRFVA